MSVIISTAGFMHTMRKNLKERAGKVSASKLSEIENSLTLGLQSQSQPRIHKISKPYRLRSNHNLSSISRSLAQQPRANRQRRRNRIFLRSLPPMQKLPEIRCKPNRNNSLEKLLPRIILQHPKFSRKRMMLKSKDKIALEAGVLYSEC